MFEKKKRDEDCCTAKIIAMDFFLFKLVNAKNAFNNWNENYAWQNFLNLTGCS